MDPTGAAERPITVFVSYRRRESTHLVGRICDRLVYEFGPANVFRDSDSIPRGTEFAAAIKRQLRSVDIMLAIIGPAWRETSLREQQDYVYMELRLAVELDIIVIPVLIDGATMPPESSLPDEIKAIVDRNAVRIGDDDHFRVDCDVLVGAIRSEVAGQRAAEAARRQFARPSSASRPPVSARPQVALEFSPGGSSVLEPSEEPPTLITETAESLPDSEATHELTTLQKWLIAGVGVCLAFGVALLAISLGGSDDSSDKEGSSSSVGGTTFVRPTPRFRLLVGESLHRGESLDSVDGRSRFLLDSNGALTLHGPKGDRVLKDDKTGIEATDVDFVTLQADGNLVAYRNSQSPENAVWNTYTVGKAARVLLLQNDGNLVLYSSISDVWSTGTEELDTEPGSIAVSQVFERTTDDATDYLRAIGYAVKSPAVLSCSDTVEKDLVRTVRPEARRNDPTANLVDYDSSRSTVTVATKLAAATREVALLVSTGQACPK